MTPDTSRTESAARDAANLAGRVEDFGGGVGDQSPNPLLDELDARNRPDPWLPWTCQGCGDEDRHGMPERCQMCGLVNYGAAS